MKKLQQAAVLVSLVDSLEENESWCGETNIQKATYFLQELLHVPLGFGFVLYKYGPYSFDLSERLTSLCADSFLEMEVRDPRYGPSYVPGEMQSFLTSRFPKTLGRFGDQIRYVAEKLGPQDIHALERLSTALYVKLSSKRNARKRVEEIRDLKPHISEEDAQEAVQTVDEMFEEMEH